MFRFTIRDMLWLTVVVAVAITLGLGWSRESTTLRKQANEAQLERDRAQQRAKAACAEVARLNVELLKPKASSDEN
jgi:hypothetical protein